MRRTNERGVTGLEILVAIAIAVVVIGGLWWLFSGGGSDAAVCRSRLPQVQRAVEVWNATTSPDDPVGERMLCTTAKDAVTRYNSQCAEIAGPLPVPTCD